MMWRRINVAAAATVLLARTRTRLSPRPLVVWRGFADGSAPTSVATPLATPVGTAVPGVTNPIEASMEGAQRAGISELEIKDPRVIFDKVWKKLETKYGDETLRVPNEIIWLMGAPGSGKGTNTPFIQKALGITSPPIIISKLLSSPEMKPIIDSGIMISDAQVLEILLEELVRRKWTYGAIVDGFPRTQVQVECTKLLYDKMIERRRRFFKTPLREHFRRPIFRIAVLFVDENESVRRQLMRGHAAIEHNEKVRLTGEGRLIEERPTDFDEALIRKRYSIFKQHYGAMLGLKERFQFHLIDASPPLDIVRQTIMREFEYQSSMELDHQTHDVIQHIPLASEIGAHSRQDLVRRLDNYQANHSELFGKAVDYITTYFIPSIKRHAIAGRVLCRTDNQLCLDPIFVEMLLDILSERGYHVNVDSKTIDMPKAVDPQSFNIIYERSHLWFFQIAFQKQQLRHTEFVDDTQP